MWQKHKCSVHVHACYTTNENNRTCMVDIILHTLFPLFFFGWVPLLFVNPHVFLYVNVKAYVLLIHFEQAWQWTLHNWLQQLPNLLLHKPRCFFSSLLSQTIAFLLLFSQITIHNLLTNKLQAYVLLFSQQTNKPLLLPLSAVSSIIFSLHPFFKSSVSLSSHFKSKPR